MSQEESERKRKDTEEEILGMLPPHEAEALRKKLRQLQHLDPLQESRSWAPRDPRAPRQ